eukprot:CAMPEP_0118675890 /NCGR_PEP_ID=MMETSP0800-20121206/1717_1 /TAXON_ID=210618 ORGANISM="Striatella unipunctata, Strain CCMP2910" /NCGR_SAMPLE_ID=MMETSP0800 /ASSEMBLY_ACC=CAM_ASM_000638 /LENGTH=121 /DNA_ID=CAMNT_0006571291 /DNA_START=98 /DNA_END=463 /DNA_ORIENTATION=-
MRIITQSVLNVALTGGGRIQSCRRPSFAASAVAAALRRRNNDIQTPVLKHCQLRYMSQDESGGDSVHSTEFKPAKSGWGGGKKNNANYDSIFGGKDKKNNHKKKEESGKEEQSTETNKSPK